jgi:hypothetical protein
MLSKYIMLSVYFSIHAWLNTQMWNTWILSDVYITQRKERDRDTESVLIFECLLCFKP